jgi:quaternary ammonium compound-resistance protein SugE
MAWFNLLIAGGFEIAWAISLKYAHGFTRLIPSIITILGMLASFYFLAQATKVLPIGTAYAVWTGIGTIGTLILGIILFQEPLTTSRLMFISLILIGILGLKFTAN